MSRRREVEQRLKMLEEVSGIMGSMKTLAMLETHKLAHFSGTQHRVVETIMAMAADFAAFNPLPEPPPPEAEVYVVIGSERGFCADFNEVLLRRLEERLQHATAPVFVITVGRKLALRLPDDPRFAVRLEGPSVAEEVEAVIARLVESLKGLPATHESLSLAAIHHAEHADEPVLEDLLPPFRDLPGQETFNHPPLLNLEPGAFLADLVDHYLFAVLHEIFYASLMTENLVRIRHLEGAIQHLKETTEDLANRRNTLRQEEITEELEVILLGADVLSGE